MRLGFNLPLSQDDAPGNSLQASDDMQPEQCAATLEPVLIGSLPALAKQLVGLLEQLRRQRPFQLPDLVALLA